MRNCSKESFKSASSKSVKYCWAREKKEKRGGKSEGKWKGFVSECAVPLAGGTLHWLLEKYNTVISALSPCSDVTDFLVTLCFCEAIVLRGWTSLQEVRMLSFGVNAVYVPCCVIYYVGQSSTAVYCIKRRTQCIRGWGVWWKHWIWGIEGHSISLISKPH